MLFCFCHKQVDASFLWEWQASSKQYGTAGWAFKWLIYFLNFIKAKYKTSSTEVSFWFLSSLLPYFISQSDLPLFRQIWTLSLVQRRPRQPWESTKRDNITNTSQIRRSHIAGWHHDEQEVENQSQEHRAYKETCECHIWVSLETRVSV